MAVRFDNRPALRAILEPIFKSKTSDAWRQTFASAGVPAGPIHKMDAVFEDPQVRHLGIVETVEHAVKGQINLIGQPVVLGRTPARLVSAIPEKGEHRGEILGEFGFSEAEIEALKMKNVV